MRALTAIILIATLFVAANAAYQYNGRRYGSNYNYNNNHGSSNDGSSYRQSTSYNSYPSTNNRYRQGYAYGYKRVTCAKLANPANGAVKSSGYYLHDTAVHSCNSGYRLSGNRVRKCQSNGKWSGSAPTCERVDCGSLQNINNGLVSVQPDTKFQSTARYTCNSGFELSGRDSRKCKADATWSGKAPVCVRVNCGSLNKINNGQVNVQPDTLYQSIATYSCDSGYELVGRARRQCQADATWSGREPYCIRVNCGSLSQISNGKVNIQPDTRFQSIATYSCSAGYRLVGQSRRQCQANRSWSGREPYCDRIDCGRLPSIPNGDVSHAPDTKFESVATYTCDQGYVRVGNEKRVCTASGSYSGSEPSCRRIDCGNLPDIVNGQVILTGTKFRDTATYICTAGYKLIGDRLRRCRSNGAWSTVAPSCVAIDCGSLTAPSNGDVVLNPGTTFGSTATYSCRRGYLLLGTQQRQCQANGQWSASQPTCQRRKCPKLSTPQYGSLYTSGYHPGDHAVFSCSYGYSVIGKSRIVCLHTGVWSDSSPSCKKSYADYDKKSYGGYDKKYEYDGPSIRHDNYYYDDKDDY